MDLNQITKPTLLVDENIAKANIKRMAAKAKVNNVVFRPHFKTHFSAEIGNWYRQQGVTQCTCSSIDMAIYFADHGWDDITIAFPVNLRQISDLNNLAQRVKLCLVVESNEVVEQLNQSLKVPVELMIKIDTGYHRTGVWHEDFERIKSIITVVDKPHRFKGLLAHFGHTYKENNAQSIQRIYESEVGHLNRLRNELNMPNCFISIGDTPSCSIVEQFGEVDEIRPGNFVFYDVMQTQITSCRETDIAVCLAVPIVAIHPERNEFVVHGGGVHLSKDRIVIDGKELYGKAVFLEEDRWNFPGSEMMVKSLSQEHGKIEVGPHDIRQFEIGDLIGILPIHSCLTANLMGEYLTLSGAKVTTLHG